MGGSSESCGRFVKFSLFVTNLVIFVSKNFPFNESKTFYS